VKGKNLKLIKVKGINLPIVKGINLPIVKGINLLIVKEHHLKCAHLEVQLNNVGKKTIRVHYTALRLVVEDQKDLLKAQDSNLLTVSHNDPSHLQNLQERVQSCPINENHNFHIVQITLLE